MHELAVADVDARVLGPRGSRRRRRVAGLQAGSRSTGRPRGTAPPVSAGATSPSCANAYITRPEQSKPLGVAPPHTYGTPRKRRASSAACVPFLRSTRGASETARAPASRAPSAARRSRAATSVRRRGRGSPEQQLPARRRFPCPARKPQPDEPDPSRDARGLQDDDVVAAAERDQLVRGAGDGAARPSTINASTRAHERRARGRKRATRTRGRRAA